MSEPVERWPFETDGAAEFQPVERVDTLTRCARCGAVVEGDVAGQAMHRVWHVNLEQQIARAASALPQVFG